MKPSKILGGIIVCRVVFRFSLQFTVRATAVLTSLQFMDKYGSENILWWNSLPSFIREYFLETVLGF